MSPRRTAQLLLLLSFAGTGMLLVLGALFKNNYPYLGDYEGDFAATASVCFRSALAFTGLGVLSILALPVAAWYERRKQRRQLLEARQAASRNSAVKFAAAEPW